MKKLFTFVLCVFLFGILSSQTLSRQVISSMGGFYGNGQINWSHTMGQPEFLTTDSSSVILTQGFEQPDAKKMIVYDQILPACDNGRGISLSVDVLEMCGQYSAVVLLNNQEVSPMIENVQPGTYQLEVTCGGINHHVMEIVVDELDIPPCELIFYSGIAPNGMDENQVWFIENVAMFSNNEVVIFDRWGNKVWQGTNYDNTNTVWSGENTSGEDLPQATYFYIFKSGSTVYKGFIELIR